MVVDTAASGGNVFEDLSGVSSSTSGNPYDALLSLCQNDQVASISFLLDFLLQLLVLRLFDVYDGALYAQKSASS